MDIEPLELPLNTAKLLDELERARQDVYRVCGISSVLLQPPALSFAEAIAEWQNRHANRLCQLIRDAYVKMPSPNRCC